MRAAGFKISDVAAAWNGGTMATDHTALQF